MIKEYGCIGRKLVHSYSVPVHNMLADYEYVLNPMEPDELEGFMTAKRFKGINVTIPYKQDVIKYLDFIDSQADEIGAVNTVVNTGGVLKGYNTDAFGMMQLIKKAGIDIKDKNVLILGTGGTSKTAMYVCKTLGAKSAVRVSRLKKENAITYEEAYTLCPDTQVIINCTPIGMFPDNLGKTPVDIDLFPCLEGAVDAVYNPLRSQLVLECEKKGIKALGGLYMLVMQAVGAVKLFTGKDIGEIKAERAYLSVLNEKRNIVLIGMPSSGKTTVAKSLAKILGRDFIDTDDLIVENAGKSITDIFSSEGEEYFRNLESEVIKDISLQTGCVIATGGGAVLREKNVDFLKANGVLIFLDRNLNELLPTPDRPLATSEEAVKKLYHERLPVYSSACDRKVVPSGSSENTAKLIINLISGGEI